MARKHRQKTARPSPPSRSTRHAPRSKRLLPFAGLALALALGIGVLVWMRPAPSSHEPPITNHASRITPPSPALDPPYVPHPRGQLTFNKDIAPIVFQQCATCHRPGQSAPFGLLTFQDVKKHAADIVDVTGRRYMPPWPPEHGYGDFIGERRLSVDQIGMLQQWRAEGQTEGSPGDLPAVPTWTGDWQLGKPDLVVAMPQPYALAPEGRDVYRNFVIAAPVPETRYVRGIEFHPGNPKIVHHAFLKVDRTQQSRRLDEQDAEPGFPGMNAPAEMPDGHFLGWQPGRMPRMGPPGLPWRLEPGDDLVLQMHLNPSGKPEVLQSEVGLYFTEQKPTNTCTKLTLTSFTIDIPAGDTNYVVEDSFVLPVDAEVLAVLPHAHYLARDMQGWAVLPDKSVQWLLWIKDWDFKWQGDYRYAKPIELPKGSTLAMRFTYDNSTNNARNPNQPPKPVAYGPQSKDEMAELWFQLLPHSPEDLSRLANAYESKKRQLFLEATEYEVRKDPRNAKAQSELGFIRMNQGQSQEAEQCFRAAIAAKPEFAEAHYRYGLMLRQQGRLPEAQAQFLEDLRLNPNDFKAHGNLGFISAQQGDLAGAQAEFESALRIDPDDPLSRQGLEGVLKALRGGGR